MVLFLLIKQGQLALQLSKLADEREAEDSEHGTAAVRIRRLRDAYQGVGKDLLELLRFVDLNATGLRKILKKFDKRVGYRLSDEYVATRSNHPYSQLQQIFRHVVNCAFCFTLLSKCLHFKVYTLISFSLKLLVVNIDALLS